jgi:excisionase family DNA binding protein
MAGKFLLLEEAALRLGISADEIHRLVEKKRLFPLRDGTTLKFKIDELDRLAAEGVNQDEPVTDTLELDLDDAAPEPAGGPINVADSMGLSDVGLDDGALGDAIQPGESIFAKDQAGQDDLAQTMLGTADAIGGLDAMELDLDSIVGLSSPSVAASAASAKPGQPATAGDAGTEGSGTLDIDLSGIGVGSQPSNAPGSNATGSLVLGSGPLGSGPLGSGVVGSGVVGSGVVGSGVVGSGPLGSGVLGSGPVGSVVLGSGVDPAGGSGSLINAGAALSGALDSGLSLEDDDAAVSGIDLGPLDEGQLAEDGATGLAGDDFELGGLGGDDDSASVVAVEPESGDSSFFATDEGGESSDFTGDIPLAAGGGTDLGDLTTVEVVPDTKFSVWQIAGLVCCALLLLTSGFVMFDLMRTIGSPDELSLSSPILNPLASIFGWRQ